jgi:hypothetical protein
VAHSVQPLGAFFERSGQRPDAGLAPVLLTPPADCCLVVLRDLKGLRSIRQPWIAPLVRLALVDVVLVAACYDGLALQALRWQLKRPVGARVASGPSTGVCARLGPKSAMVATAHKIARIIDHLLTHRTSFRDLSPKAYRQGIRTREIAAMRNEAARLGFTLVESQA